MVPPMGLSWPLRVAAHELIPVDLDGAWTNKVHLAERVLSDEAAAAATVDDASDGHSQAMTEALAVEAGWEPVWRTRTLCGRARGLMVTDPALDLLGEHRGLVCQACWRIVEGWLSPPSPAAGEDDVVRWVVGTVLETGEAMVEGVPVPRLESLRRRVRSELKAAIGGSVRTTKIGQCGLWVWSGVVNDAKTEERRQEEMRAAVKRMTALEDGQPVEPVRWRRHWSDITTGQ
jgi:hypothetical protein